MPWALRRLPFGIVDLDIRTDGGIPAGGMTMLVGKPSEGKNFLLNRLIRNQQKIYGDDCKIAVITTELPYDKSQAHLNDVAVSASDEEIEAMQERRRELNQPGLTRDEIAKLKHTIGEFYVVPPSTAENSFQAAIDLIACGAFNIVALDSFGSILSTEEAAKSMDDNAKVAGGSGLNTRLMSHLVDSFKFINGRPNLTAFVGINQVRDNLKAMAFGKQTHESGGWALKHGRFLTIEISRTHTEKHKSGALEGAAAWKTIKWEITKQKAGGHEGWVGEYNYVFDRGDIDEAELLVRVGQAYGLIKNTGKRWFLDDNQVADSFSSMVRFVEDNDLTNELYLRCLHSAGVTLVI